MARQLIVLVVLVLLAAPHARAQQLVQLIASQQQTQEDMRNSLRVTYSQPNPGDPGLLLAIQSMERLRIVLAGPMNYVPGNPAIEAYWKASLHGLFYDFKADFSDTFMVGWTDFIEDWDMWYGGPDGWVAKEWHNVPGHLKHIHDGWNAVKSDVDSIKNYTSHLPFMRQSLDGISVNVNGMAQYVKDGVTDALFPMTAMMEDLHWYETENYYAWQSWRTQWGTWRNNWNTERTNFENWRNSTTTQLDSALFQGGETPYLQQIRNLLADGFDVTVLTQIAGNTSDLDGIKSVLESIDAEAETIRENTAGLPDWITAWEGERDSQIQWRQMLLSNLDYTLNGEEEPYLKSLNTKMSEWRTAWDDWVSNWNGQDTFLRNALNNELGGAAPGPIAQDFAPEFAPEDQVMQNTFGEMWATTGLAPLQSPTVGNYPAPVWNFNFSLAPLAAFSPVGLGNIAFQVDFGQLTDLRNIFYPFLTLGATLFAMSMVWGETRRLG